TACSGGHIVGKASTTTPSPRTSAPTTEPKPYTPPVEDTPTEDPIVQLTPADMAPTLKIKSKECFGEAVCVISYEIRITLLTYNDTGSYEISTLVTGGQDGPVTDTIELTDGQYSP